MVLKPQIKYKNQKRPVESAHCDFDLLINIILSKFKKYNDSDFESFCDNPQDTKLRAVLGGLVTFTHSY